MGKQTDQKMERLDEEKIDVILLFTITLQGVHLIDVIKRNDLSFLIQQTVMVIEKVMDIDKSEG